MATAAVSYPQCALRPPIAHTALAPRDGGSFLASVTSPPVPPELGRGARIGGAVPPPAVPRGAGEAAPRATPPARVSPCVVAARPASSFSASQGTVVQRAELAVSKAMAPSVPPVPLTFRLPATGRAPQQVSEAMRENQRLCRAASARIAELEPEQPLVTKADTSPLLLEKPSGPRVLYNCSGRSMNTVTSLVASPREQATSQICKLVSIVAPGGGTSANAAVYSELAHSSRLNVEILGRARAEYDRYPEAFDGGKPAPNLESFAGGMLAQGVVEKSDCLVLGSRGGQVVLPHLWKIAGAATPPAFVINGGCAMKLPEALIWPDEAVAFLLIGGRDFFRKGFSADGYVADVKARVPARNSTTAVLFVNEMEHMPQSALLRAVLHPAVAGLLLWRESRRAPLDDFQLILASLTAGGFSGVLAFTASEGVWQDRAFGAKQRAPVVAPCEAVPPPRAPAASPEESAMPAVEAACSTSPRAGQSEVPRNGATVLDLPAAGARGWATAAAVDSFFRQMTGALNLSCFPPRHSEVMKGALQGAGANDATLPSAPSSCVLPTPRHQP